MTSAHLEHLGVVPHAHHHAEPEQGANAHQDPLSEHGIFHHHHLPDLAIVDGGMSEPVAASFVFIQDARDSVLPEAPVFGIEYPPQIS